MRFSIPPEYWLSSNQRLHRHAAAARVRWLRDYGAGMARRTCYAYRKVTVVAEIRYPTNRRADPPNAWPTVKPLIDGLVQGGLIPDDDDAHLPLLAFKRGTKTGTREYMVCLHITEEIG